MSAILMDTGRVLGNVRVTLPPDASTSTCAASGSSPLFSTLRTPQTVTYSFDFIILSFGSLMLPILPGRAPSVRTASSRK